MATAKAAKTINKRPTTKAAAKTIKNKRPKTKIKKEKDIQAVENLRAKFPRQAVGSALRIAKAILEQNAGKPCTTAEAAAFVGVAPHGPFNVEISSGIKYGFLERPQAGQIQPTVLAKKIIRPMSPGDDIEGYREAVQKAPDIAEVYKHYRGENLPDDQFLKNTVVETYGIPAESFLEFKQVFIESLETAQLLSKHGEKIRIVDVSVDEPGVSVQSERIKKLGKSANISANDSCFVMQPFAPPLGDYYEKIYKPAIEKAGLRPVRADADIFGTGKIMDQVWEGINAAKVLVAELTTRNPNVFYELGIAHALRKPVVLVSSREEDVPFDLQHIRVIYYDMSDPFWGNKLVEKVAENILSAIQNPEEAVFRSGDV
jgi:hypothetical protein